MTIREFGILIIIASSALFAAFATKNVYVFSAVFSGLMAVRCMVNLAEEEIVKNIKK